jgi:hypothetical protein
MRVENMRLGILGEFGYREHLAREKQGIIIISWGLAHQEDTPA